MSQQKTYWSRIWPSRFLGLADPAIPPQFPAGIFTSWQRPVVGNLDQAQIIVPSRAVANSGFLITAGQFLNGDAGRQLTLTITVGAGALAVSSNELDISIVEASGGSTAAAIITAFNAQFASGDFAVASALAGSSGTGKPASLTKVYATFPHMPPPVTV
jgi:hypothetical protein